MTEQCTVCGTLNGPGTNFCGGCGEKLKDFCDCWVKKQPYNCGQNLCPGYSLYLLEKIKGQAAASQDRKHGPEESDAEHQL